MKTKIITTSSSSLNYLSVPHNVAVIPDIISYSKNEEYYDYVEIQSEVFFNRLKMDFNKPNVIPNSKEYIREIIEQLQEAEYDQILFILPMNTIINYVPQIELVMSDINIPFIIYQTSLIGYPLANLIQEADEKLKEGVDIHDVVKLLDVIALNSNIFIFSPFNDLLTSISRIELDDDIIEYDKQGRVYTINTSNLVEIKKDKKSYPFSVMINTFIKSVENKPSLPFIMYSSRLSAYIKYLERVMLSLYPRLKKIKTLKLYTPHRETVELPPMPFALTFRPSTSRVSLTLP